MITSNETDKVLPALFELKKKLKPMSKDAKNPFFKSNYLDLSDLIDNLEPLLLDVGLIVTQANAHRHEDEYVVSRLSHAASGQYVEAEYKIGFVEDSQKQGGRATYGRRYSLKGLLGLSEKDDDGNLASGKGSKAKTYNKPANKPAGKQAASGFGGAAKPAAPAKPAEEKKEEKVADKPVARAGSFGG